jgi:hypothetical protein
MSDWIDYPTPYASVEDGEIVIRVPRVASRLLLPPAIKPRSVFVSDIAGLRDEIVLELNAAGYVQAPAIKPRSVFVSDIAGLRDEIVLELNAAGYVQALIGASSSDCSGAGRSTQPS